jgi:hypothetical protein
MATATVNIADFRCRGVKHRSLHAPSNSAHKASGLLIVEAEPGSAQREAELLQQARLSDDPAVFDIGIARQAKRMRPRMIFRPIVLPRHRSNVIRFDEPRVAVMRVQEPRAIQHHLASDDCDLPPAA